MPVYGRRRKWPHVLHDPAHLAAQAAGAAARPSRITKHDVDEMRREMQGRVIVPGDPAYPQDSAGNPLYPAHPQVIFYCKVFEDVRVALRWARRLELRVACRSGGHSTAGFSLNDGLVVDLSLLNYVSVDTTAQQARVGSGTQFTQLIAVLDTYGLHCPTGGCGDVAVGGFIQGGGYGFTSRELGIASDNVVSALVMLADGRLVEASAERNPDLYWAIRGGTGNNFGVVLEFTFRLVPKTTFWGFCLDWTGDDIASAMLLLQNGFTKSGATPLLGWQAAMAVIKGTPMFRMMGMYDGSRSAGLEVLEPLRFTGTPSFSQDRTGTYAQLNESLVDTCLPGIPPPPSGGAVYEIKGAGYVRQPLDRAAWARMADFFARTPNPYNIMYMEPYGGAINATSPLANAFVHRDAYMDFFVDSFWWDPKERDAAFAWRAEFESLMAPYFGAPRGHRYQNYPDRDLRDYRWSYFGDGYPTLLFVKHKYDPTDLFCFPQGISPYPDDPSINRSEAASLFSDPHIAEGPRAAT